LMRKWFLDHTEYTHLVICPDDLIIEKQHVDALIAVLEDNNYPVLAGVCNVNMADKKHLLSITENLPHPQRWVPARNQLGWRWYSWIPENRIFDPPVQAFLFSGFACQFLRRDVVKRYRFIDDAKFNGTPDLITGAIDVMFSNTCAIEKIPIMADTRVRMQHLKSGERFFDITLGDGELRFYPANKDIYTIEHKEPVGKERVWHISKGDQVIEGDRTNV